MATYEALRQRLVELDRVNGITPVEILDLPEGLHVAVRKMLKRPMTLQELAGELSLPMDETRRIGDLLVEKGYLQIEEATEDGSVLFRVYFARMRKRNIPLDL